MQAMQYILDGDLDKARSVLERVPDGEMGGKLLDQIQADAQTLSDLARAERGNREQRRAAARRRR